MGEKMDHLNKIVEQILDFARSTEPNMALVSLNRLLEDLTLLIRHKLRNANVTLVTRLAPELPELSADSAQLEQAFLNLTLNAVEAMPEGGTLTISTRPVRLSRKSADTSHLLVEFRDTGIGMAPERAKSAFSSLLSTSKPKGTGLGLAIVARVVETHRGKLRIRSHPGKGTAISLLLPR
jgi:signal transduction histidine kinase